MTKARIGHVARGTCGAAWATVAVLAWMPAESQALINPKFTPVHLVEQSQVILELKFQGEIKRGKAVATVIRTLKGKSKKQTLEFDLTSTAYADQAALVRKTLKQAKDRPALMFCGSLGDKPGEQPAQPATPEARSGKAYVHLEGMWIALDEDDQGLWAFDQVSQPMVATWNGGTDMLMHAVEYILKSPAAEMPVKTGVTWAAALVAGRVPGKVSAAVPVDLAGDGRLLLMVASDAGDRLIAFSGNSVADVTAKHHLQSKSLAFAWADFNADGRLDLASWDGKSLTIHVQGPDGTFSPSEGGKVTECIGLSAVDVGTKGKAGLIISTHAAPLLLLPGPTATPTPLAAGAWPGGELGSPGPCLVADFDNNGLPDVLQPLAQGSLLYRGTRPGSFAPPVACPVALGPHPARICPGDWDGDGLLDLFVAGEDGCRLWQNLGGGQFLECVKLAGEVGYAAPSGRGDRLSGRSEQRWTPGRGDPLFLGGAARVFQSRFPQLRVFEVDGPGARQRDAVSGPGPAGGLLGRFHRPWSPGPGPGAPRWNMCPLGSHPERLRPVRASDAGNKIRFRRPAGGASRRRGSAAGSMECYCGRAGRLSGSTRGRTGDRQVAVPRRQTADATSDPGGPAGRDRAGAGSREEIVSPCAGRPGTAPFLADWRCFRRNVWTENTDLCR